MNEQQILEGKVFSFIEEHHMLQPGDKVVVGVSGGADSVCLLFVLLEWAKQFPLELAVVHVNHGIRAEAVKDSEYVRTLCETHNLPFYLTETDVHALAGKWGMSEEEAGRRMRYESFARVAGEVSATKIAVAHNSNDRCETMLFHLFRGSGIKGLAGIRPVRDKIIRPLLCLTRQEIEEYLRIRQIAYCQDITNVGDAYTRNRIRHHILPYAEQEIATGCVQHMCHTADILEETENYLEKQTREALQRCRIEEAVSAAGSMRQQTFKKRKRIELQVHRFLQEDVVLQKRMLHLLLLELSPKQRDISYVHIRDVQELFTQDGHRQLDLPFGIRAYRQYDRVILCVGKEEVLPFSERVDISLLNQGEYTVAAESGERFIFAAFPYKKGMEVPQNQYTKWFDCDKIDKSFYVRTRETGDYLTIRSGEGAMAHKSIKDYMVTEKIPADQRNKILLLTQDSHVIWLPGYRISEYFKVNENTKNILQVQLVISKDGGKRWRSIM